MFSKSAEFRVENLKKVLDDALYRIVGEHIIEDRNSQHIKDVLMWDQMWPNTSCGFGGIVGHAFTQGITVVVGSQTGMVYVYHDGRFAYQIVAPSEEFQVKLMERKLPGKVEYEREPERWGTVWEKVEDEE